jgi:flagellar basal-body rod modification protein FlgD
MNIASNFSSNNLFSSALQDVTTPATGSGQTSGTTSGTAASTDTGNISDLATEGTFINLLVAQLENQDPLNPTDGTTFVTQLAQFTQVDQMIGIGQNVATIAQDVGNATGSSTAPTNPPAPTTTP